MPTGPGYNPARRNRNIGTAAQGHGADNRLTIPWPANEERVRYETLGAHRRLKVMVQGVEMLFVVEANSGGCVHPCSVADVVEILKGLPRTDWSDLAAIVLRQPRRKERILSPVWGRFAYSASLGARGRPLFALGPTVFLEAVDLARPIEWSVGLDPEDQQELERLAADGHAVRREGGRWRIEVTAASARATQLYRTLPHEIGHHVDWLTKVERAPAGVGTWEEREEAFFARPRQEREAFAHRYAETAMKGPRAAGFVPFEPLTDA